MTTLTQLLQITDHPATKTRWDERIVNSCWDDLIERFDDCWEGLIDFQQSDWVNLCEPYTYQLLDQWVNRSKTLGPVG